ncbi:MAG: PilN domain-containing protein [Patescibacteria group bacterium]
MANLLPTTERLALLAGRKRKLTTVSTILVAGTLAVAIALLLPSLITVLARKESSDERLLATQKLLDLQKETGTGADLVRTQETITLLGNTLRSVSPYESVRDLVDLIPSGVTVRHISIATEGETTTISFSGMADTRTALISFGDRLRQSGLFAQVLIPLPALAQNIDIAFDLHLVFTHSEKK